MFAANGAVDYGMNFGKRGTYTAMHRAQQTSPPSSMSQSHDHWQAAQCMRHDTDVQHDY
jgi:hypothetical protein